ncbi:pyridoxamine 5'-phosphate oxidase family protein [Lipingzhangella sp. LS1_29]|uniref:Pyridoxamine 5'-phosphate oxidase family protein n=1 Tax=Lipingzhangella rawalii TaxID=2055835 RepID=A0ABU2H2D4_9ACTN|nr:pyridoxamine 5'-phosphate oxidase family protein [Lipingzhangella rawalii]MDS1269025.1 pyridoxamine 5'-phosphate oxidase family protein [Lipingzhangella rawalii]
MLTAIPPFDIEEFLRRPLVARVATNATNGPTVRPVWFLWEQNAFWWITGSYSRVAQHLRRDARVSLVVDTCDLGTLEVLQVNVRGTGEIRPFDPQLARRKLVRYLGEDETTWPRDFHDFDEDTRLVRMQPDRLIARDLSKQRAADPN